MRGEPGLRSLRPARSVGAWLAISALAAAVLATVSCEDAQEEVSRQSPTGSLCTAPTPTPTPPESATYGFEWRWNEFCGSVTIDGALAPDGTKVELYVPSFRVCQIDAPPLAAVETAQGYFAAGLVGSPGSQGGMPFPATCPPEMVYFKVAGRWANETAILAREPLARTLDLNVTTPLQVDRSGSQSNPDPRLMTPSLPPCEAKGTPEPYLIVQYYEVLSRDAKVRYPADVIGVGLVRVRVPEVGLEVTSGEYGCVVLSYEPVDTLRTVTVVAEKEGYGSHITKNLIVSSSQLPAFSVFGELRRDGVPTVDDRCYFPYPPASAGEMGRVEQCRSVHALPPFLARNCEHPEVRRQQAFDPNLRVQVGVVLDAETGAAVTGATVEIPEYQLRVTSTADGCYSLGEFATTGVEFVTLMASADGYGQLTVNNFRLGSYGSFDLQMTRGHHGVVQDWCRLGPPEDQSWVGREVLCREAGLLSWEGVP